MLVIKAHQARQTGVFIKVLVLAVYRDIVLRLDKVNDGLDLLLTGVAGDMDIVH